MQVHGPAQEHVCSLMATGNACTISGACKQLSLGCCGVHYVPCVYTLDKNGTSTEFRAAIAFAMNSLGHTVDIFRCIQRHLFAVAVHCTVRSLQVTPIWSESRAKRIHGGLQCTIKEPTSLKTCVEKYMTALMPPNCCSTNSITPIWTLLTPSSCAELCFTAAVCPALPAHTVAHHWSATHDETNL